MKSASRHSSEAPRPERKHLSRIRFLIHCAVFLGAASTLLASPKLRLSSATIGPLLIAVGQKGATQSVDAANAGDGSLNLTASSNVTWIAASIAAPHACSVAATCLGVQIALNTSSLAKGSYTGTVTVSDPNAVDAPQTITVTVAMGG